MTLLELVDLALDSRRLTEDGGPVFVPVPKPDGSVEIHSRFTGKCWTVPDLHKITPEAVMNFATNKPVHLCPDCGSTNLDTITRIVGYYSRISNWNNSKIGELADRRTGQYLPGEA